MNYKTTVSADSLTWPHAYCNGVKVHPNDNAAQHYVNSGASFTSGPDGSGVDLVLVAYKSKSMTAHFRRRHAISSEYLSSVRGKIHDRVVQVASQYIRRHGEIALESICKADVSGFKYAECSVEQNMVVGDIAYRPDIVVYQKDHSLPRIELEVVFTHDIERDRSEVLSKSGHLLLSINIERWANSLAQQEIEDVSDEQILDFVVGKKFSHKAKKDRVLVERIWDEMYLIDLAVQFADKVWDGERFVGDPITAKTFLTFLNGLNAIVERDYSHEITEKAKDVIAIYNSSAPYAKEVLRKYGRTVSKYAREREEREHNARVLFRQKQERLRHIQEKHKQTHVRAHRGVSGLEAIQNAMDSFEGARRNRNGGLGKRQ